MTFIPPTPGSFPPAPVDRTVSWRAYRESTIIVDADNPDLTPHERGYDDGYYSRGAHIDQRWGDEKRQEYADGYSEGEDRREMESYMSQGDDNDD